MRECLVLHGVRPLVREEVRDYWSRKRRRVERVLGPRRERAHLRLVVRRPGDERYEVHATLTLGRRVLATTEERRELHEALDAVADTLVLDLRRLSDVRTASRRLPV